jgi:hypothetical protein
MVTYRSWSFAVTLNVTRVQRQSRTHSVIYTYRLSLLDDLPFVTDK